MLRQQGKHVHMSCATTYMFKVEIRRKRSKERPVRNRWTRMQ